MSVEAEEGGIQEGTKKTEKFELWSATVEQRGVLEWKEVEIDTSNQKEVLEVGRQQWGQVADDLKCRPSICSLFNVLRQPRRPAIRKSS